MSLGIAAWRSQEIGVVSGENLILLGNTQVPASTFNTYGVVQSLMLCFHRFLRWLLTFKSSGLGATMEDIATTWLYSIRIFAATKIWPLCGFNFINQKRTEKI